MYHFIKSPRLLALASLATNKSVGSGTKNAIGDVITLFNGNYLISVESGRYERTLEVQQAAKKYSIFNQM